jgi:DNA polymerase-1
MTNAGILRSACYITNVVKERPNGNNIDLFINLSAKDVTKAPRYDSYLAYLELLREEIAEAKPNVVVAVGAVPLWALCGKRGITKWRGSILESTLVPGTKVIPTIHPAAALRQYTFTHMILHDLRRVLAESTSPAIRLPVRNLQIKPTSLEVEAYLARCMQHTDVIATDIEVINDEVSCISFALSPTDCMCIPFVYKGGPYWDIETEARLWRQIGTVLEAKPMIGQNLAFDSTFLYSKFGIRVKVAGDTMVGQAIACPDFPKGLDFITSIYTREPYFKDEGKKWKNPGMSDEQFYLYNAKDSTCCLEAYHPIMADIAKLDDMDVYLRHVSLIPPLTFIQYNGIAMDQEGMAKERRRLENLRIDLLTELQTLCEATAEAHGLHGYRLNPNSPQQLKDYFYVLKSLRPHTKKGSVTTDEKALKQIAAGGCREASLVLQYRKATKLVGTYLDMTFDADGRFRGSLNPVGTKSGRFSSSKTISGTGGNMQNQPEVMKKFMQADPGKVLLVLDLEQAENRLVAYLAPDARMISAFETGTDIHSQTASLILNKPIEQISRVKGSSPLGNGEQSERDWGKRCNHALNYGMGEMQFSIVYEIEKGEARFLRDKYLSVYTGVPDYWAWIQAQLHRDRTLTNPLGRKRRFLDRMGDELYKEAYSHIPQSTVADIINGWGLLPIWQDQKAFRHVTLTNQEHDSLWLQVPLALGWDGIAGIVNRIIRNVEQPLEWRGRTFTIPLGVKIGGTVGGAKEAKKQDGLVTGDVLHEAYIKSMEA